jgi:hypothetical protein
MNEVVIQRPLVLEPDLANPRNSEGDFVALKDGRWLFVYTHFDGGDNDHAAAHLAGRYSHDGGETWSDEDVIILPNEAAMNVMSVSLVRLDDGRIALVYLRKHALTDCRPYLRYSTDEAVSWSEPVAIIPDAEAGYYVVNNDRVVQLPSGRLVLPAARHSKHALEPVFSPYGEIVCYLSDDRGRTWRRGQDVLVEAQPDGSPVMVQEPGVVALNDGRLMLFCRTDAGCQYVAYSGDEGETWSPLHASAIISPCSPASIKRLPATGDLLLVWNDHTDIDAALTGLRTPLTTAISQDEGGHWRNVRKVATNPHGWYCYTAIAFAGEHLLLAHTAGYRRENNGLATLQITRLPVVWLYG